MGKDPEVRANQRYWFRRQLNLAREKALPVSIHSRDAAKDTLDIAKEEHLAEIGGVVHCFSYTVEMAREYLNMGMYLGIGGVLTYKFCLLIVGASYCCRLLLVTYEKEVP